MATKRSRIIYASQSVFIDGMQTNRVQTLGSTTTFRNEDIYELGQLELIDVVDDIPAVAVTLDHNNVDSSVLVQKLCGVSIPKGRLVINASGYDGVALSDFARTAHKGVAIWAPVQDESKMGARADNTIESTMFMDNCFVNRLDMAFTVGANATENYTLETDNKTWLLNHGRYVNWVAVSGGDPGWTEVDSKGFEITIASGVNICGCSGQNRLSKDKVGFLFKNKELQPCVRIKVNGYLNDAGTISEIPIVSGLHDSPASTTSAMFYPAAGEANNGLIKLRLPSGTVDGYNCLNIGASDKIYMAYCADGYDTTICPGNVYFDEDAAKGQKGALRQGQIEAYIVDKNGSIGSTPTWRLQGVTTSSDLTREPLSQLSNLRPYDRPVKTPIPITVTVDSTAADLETFAMFAGKETVFNAGSVGDIDIATLLAKKNLSCVIYMYHQTDEEAGGTHANRVWKENTTIKYENGDNITYNAGAREYPQKVIVIKDIYPTDEAYNLDTRANATQRFGFAARNAMYMIDTHNISAAAFNYLEANITKIDKA